jgi:hypothetical protein
MERIPDRNITILRTGPPLPVTDLVSRRFHAVTVTLWSQLGADGSTEMQLKYGNMISKPSSLLLTGGQLSSLTCACPTAMDISLGLLEELRRL